MNYYNLKDTKRKATPKLGSLIASLKDRVTLEEVVERLGLPKKLNLQKTGSSLQGECPTGHSSTSGRCFSLDTANNLYHCFHCGEAGDIVELVALVNHIGRFQAVRWIAEQFDQSVISQLDAAADQETPEQKEYHQRGVLYQMIFEEGKRQLSLPNAQLVMDYLVKDRGYDATKLADTEFIYWDTDKDIRAYLVSKAPQMQDQIEALRLQGGYGDNFRLAIPFRDRHGVITGFMKRAHEKAGFTLRGKPGIRWDSTPGLDKSDLFGLNRIRKAEDLVVVEGYPDATYLPALGLTNIVALGQAAFSDKYINGLLSKEVRRIILALDNDGGTGDKNTEDICQRLADSDIGVFVIDPPTMGKEKDPDEYVQINGIDAFKKLVANAESASKWMAKRLMSKHDLKSDLGRTHAIDEALDYADSLKNALEAEAIVGALALELSLTPENLEKEFERTQQKKAAERLQEGIANVGSQVRQLIQNGEPEEAARLVAVAPLDLLADFRKTKQAPQTPLSEYLGEKKLADRNRTAGKRIGYQLNTFSEVDSKLCGLQAGLYIAAADPNIGKTAFMVSLAIDVLKANPDVHSLFYTMDDSRDTIINRFLANRTDMAINSIRFKPVGTPEEQMIDTAYKEMGQWASSGRLDIKEISEWLTMSAIQNDIQSHPHRDKLVVFIDGLYNVPMDENFRSLREENIQRANQVKQLVKLFKIPVIATAEFRKQGREEPAAGRGARTIHDIMETGKYGYNADLIWLLSPKDPDKYATEDEPIILMEFGKNKLESFRGRIELKFIRAKSTMIPMGGIVTTTASQQLF
ncbi:MAG: CHC2 zinc finger domain-containing protein [Ignavibacteriales bacterium]|nr:CHC2 zinc finger domain-containing protein [Ignavibacteriales bacterium]